MDPICNGTFLLVSADNAVEANMALGVPRQDAETMSDPRSKVRHDIEVEGNHIRWQFVYPTCPKYNHTYNMQLGETLELQEPISLSITAKKENGHTFCCEMVAGSKKSTYVVTFSQEGCTTQVAFFGKMLSTFSLFAPPRAALMASPSPWSLPGRIQRCSTTKTSQRLFIS